MIYVAKLFFFTSQDPIPHAISLLKHFALSAPRGVHIFHSQAFDRSPLCIKSCEIII